jgi:hypothetical protein
MSKLIFVFSVIIVFATQANADIADKLSRFVGYSIIHSGTITGYQDKRNKPNDSFEGCDYDRVIFIDDAFRVTCATYSYTYAYRPTVVILSRGGNLKMIVGNDIFDIRK